MGKLIDNIYNGCTVEIEGPVYKAGKIVVSRKVKAIPNSKYRKTKKLRKLQKRII